MKYRILGTLEVVVDDSQTVALDSPKQRALLATLLAHPNHVVSMDRLADVLWGEDQPEDPGAALQTHISRLRKTLRFHGNELEPLTTEAFGYKLSVGSEQLDANRFETLIDTARATSPSAEALALLDQSLKLWRGDPFAEFSDLDFARSECSRLLELHATALELRAESLLALARFEQAVSFLETVVAKDPLRERPRALLMQALYGCGRQGEALGVLQQFRRLLSEELGIEPSPALRELERSILGHALPGPDFCATPALPGLALGIVFEPHPLPQLEISYSNIAGNRNVAYGTVGDGPPIVVIPAFVTNLTTIAEGRDPRSGLIQGLSERFKVILYDRYGTGLSTGDNTDFSTESSTDELEAIIDQLRLESVAVVAMSCAGPVGLTLASRRPDRVSHLILLGTYADGPSTFFRKDLQESMLGLVRAHWGIASKIMVDMMFPGAGPEIAERFARMQKEAATPEVAALCLNELYCSDVSDLLSQIETPSLVMHYTEDLAFPFQSGRELAAGLPNARLIPLSGRFHLPSESDLPNSVELISEFIDPK